MGRSFSAYIPSGKSRGKGPRLRCECSGPTAKWAEFVDAPLLAAFDEAFDSVEREIVATWGDYRTPLASKSRGTLRRDGPTGVIIDLPDDDAGRAALAAHESDRDRCSGRIWILSSRSASRSTRRCTTRRSQYGRSC